METLLIGVAVVSLVLASTMGVVAWRLLRGDRQRSRARVELLAALAAEPDASPDVIASDIAAAAPAPPAFADALVVETTTFRASVPAPEPARLRIDLPVRDETVSVDDVDPVDVIRPSQPPQPDVAPAHVSRP